jgi:LytS/YehU family sensor histidine kinase
MVYARTSGSLDAIRYASRQQIMAKYEGRSNINELIQDFDQLVVSQYDDYKLKIEREQKDLALANENEIKLIQDKTTAEIKAIQSRDRSIIIAIVTGILLLLAYILYQRRIFKFARQKLLIQQRLLRSQMNPHFTFNVLSTIQNQIKPNPQEAENYLVKFSRLLRLILENSTKDYILLEKEIESLNKYVQLQQIRFPNLFDFKIEYLDMEEDEFLFIPPMLLQPFVENSIEHGFDGVDYRAEIRITLSRKQNYLHCTIEDNGKGFKDSNVNEKSSLSTNLISTYLKDATKSKIDVINKRDSDTEKSGLITRFLIPYKTTDA